MKKECRWRRIGLLSFYQTAGRFFKRCNTFADSAALREVVLSAARETGCPQHVRKREWRSLSPFALEYLNMSENMPVNSDNAALQQRNGDWGLIIVVLLPLSLRWCQEILSPVNSWAHCRVTAAHSAWYNVAVLCRDWELLTSDWWKWVRNVIKQKKEGLCIWWSPLCFNLCSHVSPQLHVRAQRASFVAIICAAFLTVGSVTMTTTVRTTQMKGTVVSGGSLLAACLWVIVGCTNEEAIKLHVLKHTIDKKKWSSVQKWFFNLVFACCRRVTDVPSGLLPVWQWSLYRWTLQMWWKPWLSGLYRWDILP